MAPNFYESYLGRGIVNRNIGNYSEAINDFKKYMEYKKDESVYTGLGDVYMVTGNYEEAKKILEVARNRYPNSKVIKDMLIRTYAELKITNLPEEVGALEWYRLAVKKLKDSSFRRVLEKFEKV